MERGREVEWGDWRGGDVSGKRSGGGEEGEEERKSRRRDIISLR